MDDQPVPENRVAEILILTCGVLSFYPFLSILASKVGIAFLSNIFVWLWDATRSSIVCVPAAAGLVSLVAGWASIRSSKSRIRKVVARLAIYLGTIGVLANSLLVYAVMVSN